MLLYASTPFSGESDCGSFSSVSRLFSFSNTKSCSISAGVRDLERDCERDSDRDLCFRFLCFFLSFDFDFECFLCLCFLERFSFKTSPFFLSAFEQESSSPSFSLLSSIMYTDFKTFASSSETKLISFGKKNMAVICGNRQYYACVLYETADRKLFLSSSSGSFY